MKLKIVFNIKEQYKNKILKNISRKYLNASFHSALDIIKTIIKFDENNLIDKVVFLNFVSDSEIKTLNKLSRWINKSTDCLSFPYSNDDENPIFWDIFIAMPHIEKQSIEYWVSLRSEISKMFIHSLLHLFWYDHQKDKDYKEMKVMEEKIANKLIF